MATLSNNMRKQNFGKTALPGFNQRGNTWKRHALARGGPRHFARCDVVDLHDVQLGAPCQSAWVKKCLWIVKTTEVLWLYIHIHIHIHIYIYIVSVKHAVLHGRNPPHCFRENPTNLCTKMSKVNGKGYHQKSYLSHIQRPRWWLEIQRSD